MPIKKHSFDELKNHDDPFVKLSTMVHEYLYNHIGFKVVKDDEDNYLYTKAIIGYTKDLVSLLSDNQQTLRITFGNIVKDGFTLTDSSINNEITKVMQERGFVLANNKLPIKFDYNGSLPGGSSGSVVINKDLEVVGIHNSTINPSMIYNEERDLDSAVTTMFILRSLYLSDTQPLLDELGVTKMDLINMGLIEPGPS